MSRWAQRKRERMGLRGLLLSFTRFHCSSSASSLYLAHEGTFCPLMRTVFRSNFFLLKGCFRCCFRCGAAPVYASNSRIVVLGSSENINFMITKRSSVGSYCSALLLSNDQNKSHSRTIQSARAFKSRLGKRRSFLKIPSSVL